MYYLRQLIRLTLLRIKEIKIGIGGGYWWKIYQTYDTRFLGTSSKIKRNKLTRTLYISEDYYVIKPLINSYELIWFKQSAKAKIKNISVSWRTDFIEIYDLFVKIPSNLPFFHKSDSEIHFQEYRLISINTSINAVFVSTLDNELIVRNILLSSKWCFQFLWNDTK